MEFVYEECLDCEVDWLHKVELIFNNAAVARTDPGTYLRSRIYESAILSSSALISIRKGDGSAFQSPHSSRAEGVNSFFIVCHLGETKRRVENDFKWFRSTKEVLLFYT